MEDDENKPIQIVETDDQEPQMKMHKTCKASGNQQ